MEQYQKNPPVEFVANHRDYKPANMTYNFPATYSFTEYNRKFLDLYLETQGGSRLVLECVIKVEKKNQELLIYPGGLPKLSIEELKRLVDVKPENGGELP